MNGCTSWHSRYLHGATVPGLILTLQGDIKTVLLIQAIPLKDGGEATAFWDPGATTALVTFKFAAENNLMGKHCTFQLSGVEGVKKRNYILYPYSTEQEMCTVSTHMVSQG